MRTQSLLTLLFIVLICGYASQHASAQYTWFNQNGIQFAGNIGLNPGSQELGHPGPSDTALNFPYGLCVDGSGNVYIADFFNDRVQKWHVGDAYGTTVAGVTGDSTHLNHPTAVALDHNGNLFVADRNNNRIVKYTAASINVSNGQTASTASPTLFAGGYATLTAQKNHVNAPTGLFITAGANDDTVYVAEGNDNTNIGVFRVLAFPPNYVVGDSGILVAGGGHYHGQGISATTLNEPLGIFVDKTTRDVYVADYGYARVQKWAPPYVTGVTVAGSSLGAPGSNDSLLNCPSGVWVDANGNVIVTDYLNSRIMEWAPGALAGSRVVGTGLPGIAVNQISAPYGICLDANKNLFVTDPSYQLAKEFTYSPTSVPVLNSAITKVELYPNPNSGSFTVSGNVNASLNGKQVYIIVLDMNAKVVLSEKAIAQNGNVSKHIDMGKELPNGVYQVQLVSGNNSANSKFQLMR